MSEDVFEIFYFSVNEATDILKYNIQGWRKVKGWGGFASK